MKNKYIVVLIVLVIGILFFFNTNNTEENEVKINNQGTQTTTEENIPQENQNINTQDISVGDVKEFTVSGKSYSFTPSVIKVKKGDKVKITFQNTEGFHNFVIDEFGIATNQAKSPATEIIEFTADKAGSFEYYCSVGTHRALGMKGTLIIE